VAATVLAGAAAEELRPWDDVGPDAAAELAAKSLDSVVLSVDSAETEVLGASGAAVASSDGGGPASIPVAELLGELVCAPPVLTTTPGSAGPTEGGCDTAPATDAVGDVFWRTAPVSDPVDVSVVCAATSAEVVVLFDAGLEPVDVSELTDVDTEDDDVDPDVSACANPHPYPVITAVPMPMAAARPPTRPTYVAVSICRIYGGRSPVTAFSSKVGTEHTETQQLPTHVG
jgi:hypothetical protein